MFDKILIANRGEIACRVMETARRMGVSCVAVHSQADAGAKHVVMADQAVAIGGPAAAESYLKGDVIIQAALATGASAIHPGYGFLSENPDFVDAVEAAGLRFIGPSAQAIRSIGLKDAAKVLMEKAGVPVVPGYHGADQNPELLSDAAARIGYPVLIKAVAGGGGKGMRRVDRPADFSQSLAAAQAEARNAFGNADVLIEKYIEKPRHIEVQVFGDGTNAVHLFERDCSLQRRHQKVIEEAPAPGMTDEMRQVMGEAAVRAACAIGYAGAGTVEFIVDASDGLRPGRFWFMEMNTRLQVEHPVTEAITGVDLVEWQLRVAAGEGLPVEQCDLSIQGHAFEARLYAEDAAKGFLPATGRLEHLAFPSEARCDSGVRPGDDISPWYDPMIAKIIVHGPTRSAALKQLKRALERTEIGGTVTNVAFLKRLAAQSEFAAGDVDTGLIERTADALCAAPEPDGAVVAMAAIAALGLENGAGQKGGFSLWSPLRWEVGLVHDAQDFVAGVEVLGDREFRVSLGEATHHVTRSMGQWRIDGVGASVRFARWRDTVAVYVEDGFAFRVKNPLDRLAAAQHDADQIDAPMPGLVKALTSRPGQAVSKGDRLAVLEAMKMEHSLVAGRDGVVAEVFVREGDQVEGGAALVRLEPDA